MSSIFLVREGKDGEFLNALTQSDSGPVTKREAKFGWVFKNTYGVNQFIFNNDIESRL
jgi:hypothetical protein